MYIRLISSLMEFGGSISQRISRELGESLRAFNGVGEACVVVGESEWLR